MHFTEDVEPLDVDKLGKVIRYSETYREQGTNVNFVNVLAPGSLKVRTYERGVENETMACGTGAVASGLVAAVLGMTQSPVKIVTSGNDQLSIIFDLKEGPAASNVYLKGPAYVIYSGDLNAESLIDK